MDVTRKTAILVGVLFIIGTAAGILSGAFTAPIFDSPAFLVSISANSTQILLGVVCVLIMGFSLAMIPVLLYPIFRRYNTALAMGSVVFRGALETVAYIAMAVVWLLLISLSQEYVGGRLLESSYYQSFGAFLLSVNSQINPVLEVIFSLGALMIYYLFFQSRLIPRWLSGWGLVGGVLYLAAGLSAIFGIDVQFLVYILALQEMVLALWLIIKGFVPSAVSAELHKEIPGLSVSPGS